MNIKSRFLGAALGLVYCSAALAQSYYYDINGTTTGSGVSNGGSYVWNTTDSFWNTDSTGGGGGAFNAWVDNSASPATAYFSAGGGGSGYIGSNYVVTIPSGQVRDINYLWANGDNVTLSGAVRPDGVGTYNRGFGAVNPGVLTFSNLTVLTTNCDFVNLNSGNYYGLFNFSSGVNVGYKQWAIPGYSTVDFGNLLDQNLIFTTNYPGGGQIACLFFNNYADNAVIQGSGTLTVPLGNWYSGPFPCIAWNGDGYGNNCGGGFAGRGGKLTVNLGGDGHTIAWGTNNFVGDGNGNKFNLIFNSYNADSPVEFQNGLDLKGRNATIKVLSTLYSGSTNAIATISGAISDTAGGGTLTKVSQNGYQAAGTLILSGANTYSGVTAIKEGEIVITSAHIGGGEFDVYCNPFTNANSALGINITSSSVTIPMSALVMQNITTLTADYESNFLDFNYVSVNTNGAVSANNFTVNNTNVTINVSGSLHLGQFPLIKYQGSIGGNGFAALALGSLPTGVTATLVDNSGNHSVDLNVTAVPTLSTPKIVNVSVSGGNVNFTATNGTPNASCAVLNSANLALPASSWTTNTTATFNANGAFQFSSPISGSQQYYRLKQ